MPKFTERLNDAMTGSLSSSEKDSKKAESLAPKESDAPEHQ